MISPVLVNVLRGKEDFSANGVTSKYNDFYLFSDKCDMDDIWAYISEKDLKIEQCLVIERNDRCFTNEQIKDLFFKNFEMGVKEVDIDAALAEVKRGITNSYVKCIPIFLIGCKKYNVMGGGNYVYSSHSGYENITGVSYPIMVVDRCEEWNS